MKLLGGGGGGGGGGVGSLRWGSSVLCMGIGSTVELSFVTLAHCFSSLAHPCSIKQDLWDTA